MVLVIFALIGAWRGFVRQVFSLLAFVLAGLFAAPLGVLMAAPVIESSDWGPGAATNIRIGFVIGVAIGIYIITKIIGAWADRSVGRRSSEESHKLAPWNRYWGAALSILKAAILCWLVLCFLVAFPKIAPGASERVQESWAVRTAHLFNPVGRWIVPEQRAEMEKALVALWKLKRDPSKWDKVIEEESIQRVLKHERLVELLDAGQGDLMSALMDEDFRKSLREIDWDGVAKIADDAHEEAEESSGQGDAAQD